MSFVQSDVGFDLPRIDVWSIILVYHLLPLARPRSTIVSRTLESTLLIDMTWHCTANAKRSQDCDLIKCKDRINQIDISCHCFSRSCLVGWPEGELIKAGAVVVI